MAKAKASHRRSKEKRQPVPIETGTLNFKVTNEFKKQFKGYAVSQGMTMVELLKDGFELSKQKRNR